MNHRILFIATLHHPQQLIQDHAANPDNPPLFPTNYGYHYWEKVFKKRGYMLDVFWRNLAGFGNQDVASIATHRYTERITPGRVAQALLRRFPAQANVDYQQRNANLLKQAEHFQPTIIWLIGDNMVVYPDTLQKLKERHNAKVIYASGTSPIVFSRPIERAAARLYDLVLVNDYYHGIQWMELGSKHMACLPVTPGIDPEYHNPERIAQLNLPDVGCDVAFVGTLLPYALYSERIAALEALRDFDLGVWSIHDAPESLQSYVRGSAMGEAMLNVLMSSKISLNTHGDFMRYGGNMRLFECAGMGAFQLVDDRPGIADWFTDGEHLIIYRDLDDLRDKVKYYLDHPEERRRIAEAARAHVLAHHTYDHRLDVLEELISTW